MVGGISKFNGEVGHPDWPSKGMDARKWSAEILDAHPGGVPKALRLMKMAESFGKPVLTLIDTPGPSGVGAEERGQAEAIARNLRMMMLLRTPIVTTVIGEGAVEGPWPLGLGIVF